jgi:hypothetical protein
VIPFFFAICRMSSTGMHYFRHAFVLDLDQLANVRPPSRSLHVRGFREVAYNLTEFRAYFFFTNDDATAVRFKVTFDIG